MEGQQDGGLVMGYVGRGKAREGDKIIGVKSRIAKDCRWG